MQGAGEQQEGEHALQQRLTEVDGENQGSGGFRQMNVRRKVIDAQNSQRGDEGNHNLPDGPRQVQIQNVDHADHGDDEEQNWNDIQ